MSSGRTDWRVPRDVYALDATAGRRLAMARTRLGWSQTMLARRAGLSASFVSVTERGGAGRRRRVRRAAAEAVARAVGWPDWAALVSSNTLDPPPPLAPHTPRPAAGLAVLVGQLSCAEAFVG